MTPTPEEIKKIFLYFGFTVHNEAMVGSWYRKDAGKFVIYVSAYGENGGEPFDMPENMDQKCCITVLSDEHEHLLSVDVDNPHLAAVQANLLTVALG